MAKQEKESPPYVCPCHHIEWNDTHWACTECGSHFLPHSFYYRMVDKYEHTIKLNEMRHMQEGTVH